MKKLFWIAAAAVACGLAVSAPARAASDAGSFQLNPAHDGQIKFSRPFAGPLKRKWSVELGGPVVNPVFGGGRLFVTVVKGGRGILTALDADSGALLWEVDANGNGPAYDAGRVFVVNLTGLVQAYNAADGSLAWSKQQQSGVDRPFYFDTPVAAAGRVYFDGTGSGQGTLYSLDAKTGARRWAADGTDGAVPVLAGDTVFEPFPCDEQALGRNTGHARWTYTDCSGGGSVAMTAYFENRLYVNESHNMVVLDATTGEKVGDAPFFKYMPAFWTNPSGHSMGFYFDGRKLNGFDTVTGETLWQTARRHFGAAPLVINDTVVAGTVKGHLFGLDPLTGSVLWSQHLGTAIHGEIPPYVFAAGDDKLFVPSDTRLSAWVSR